MHACVYVCVCVCVCACACCACKEENLNGCCAQGHSPLSKLPCPHINRDRQVLHWGKGWGGLFFSTLAGKVSYLHSSSVFKAPSVSSISAVEASSLPTSGGASRDKGSGGGELLSIVAATLAAALVALVLTGLTAMVCMAVRRRRKGRGTEVAKSNSIGELYLEIYVPHRKKKGGGGGGGGGGDTFSQGIQANK